MSSKKVLRGCMADVGLCCPVNLGRVRVKSGTEAPFEVYAYLIYKSRIPMELRSWRREVIVSARDKLRMTPTTSSLQTLPSRLVRILTCEEAHVSWRSTLTLTRHECHAVPISSIFVESAQ